MSQLHLVSKASAEHSLNVVFLHGLGGDHCSTWKSNGPNASSWPDWLSEDFPEVSIYSIQYDANPSRWLGPSMPIYDQSMQLIELLNAKGVFDHPIILITHSMGGLIAKQMIQIIEAFQVDGWASLRQRIAGVVFIATPHTGSSIPKYIGMLRRILRTSENVSELQRDNAQLRSLNDWFRNTSRDLGVSIKVFCEKLDTYGVRVVDESSSNPGISGVIPIPILADHFRISKPSRGELVYLSTSNFLEECLKSESANTTRLPDPISTRRPPAPEVIDKDVAKLDYRQLIEISTKFGLTNAPGHSRHELRSRVSPLIGSLRHSLEKIDEIGSPDSDTVALRQKAAEASRHFQFNDTEIALAQVHANDFQVSAATGEARAANALLSGNAKLAHDLFQANFLGYANLSADTAFKKALEYCQALYNFALNSDMHAFRLCESLAVQAIVHAPSDLSWSNTMRLVGNARYNLAMRVDQTQSQSLLKQASEAYFSAKSRVSPLDHPEAWCSANQNIAVAYEALSELPETKHSYELLLKCIGLHDETLGYLKRSEFPSDWAMTRQNRGNAFRRLGGCSSPGESCAFFRRSVRDLLASLLVRRRSSDPFGWATSTHNLGNTYRDLALSVQGSAQLRYLRRAKQLYAHAMEERTLSAVPVRYAISAQNSARTLIELANRDAENQSTYTVEAEFLLVQSGQVFSNAGMEREFNANKVLQDRIE